MYIILYAIYKIPCLAASVIPYHPPPACVSLSFYLVRARTGVGIVNMCTSRYTGGLGFELHVIIERHARFPCIIITSGRRFKRVLTPFGPLGPVDCREDQQQSFRFGNYNLLPKIIFLLHQTSRISFPLFFKIAIPYFFKFRFCVFLQQENEKDPLIKIYSSLKRNFLI